jgi:hypothetical protein
MAKKLRLKICSTIKSDMLEGPYAYLLENQAVASKIHADCSMLINRR